MFRQNAVVAIVAVCVLYSVFAQNPTKCKGVDMSPTDPNVMKIIECLNSTGDGSMKNIKNQTGCFTKCVMLKHGTIDEKGMLQKDKISISLAAGIPDVVKDPLTAQIGQCFDQAGGKLDMADKTCAAFSPLTDCILTAYTALCT